MIPWLMVRTGLSKLAIWAIITLVASGILVSVWYGFKTHYYNAGVMDERAVWVAKQLEATIERLELELKVAKDTTEIDSAINASTNEELDNANKFISELRDKLRKSGNSCKLGDDWRRLQ